MTEEELETVCSELARGKSLRRICREMDKDEGTVRYWLKKDEDAFTHSARARELGCDALADECIDIADGDDPTDVKRVKIDTRIRLIGKWSQRYSDKVTVNSESTVTHRHELKRLNDAELEEVERILANAAGGEGRDVTASPSRVH